MSGHSDDIPNGTTTNGHSLDSSALNGDTPPGPGLEHLQGLDLLTFPNVRLTSNCIRELRRQAATIQSIYRGLGVRYYDLPAATQSQLMENNATKITEAFAATASSPEPEMMQLLNRASALIDEVDTTWKGGEDEEALDALQTAANVLFRVRPDLMQAMTVVFDVQMTEAIYINSQTRQAQAGLLPVAFLRWCQGLREVKVAIDLGTLDGDNPHAVLSFVVTEEERELPALDLRPRTPENGTPWSEWLGDGV